MILGCSVMIAGVFFLVGLLIALGSTGAKFGPSLGIAGMNRFMPEIYVSLMAGLCEEYGIESFGTFPITPFETVGDLVLEARALLEEKPPNSRTIPDGDDLERG
jgi:hypothetical protein